MNSVGLFALAVCGLGLFAMFAHWRSFDREASMAGGRSTDVAGARSVADGPPDEGVSCPLCGSENDDHPYVTFCWWCTERLED